MQIVLTVIEGPHLGRKFVFDRHDHFFVGRAKFAQFQLPEKDPYFSRMHFMIEVNPPACRLLDLGSTNGTSVNGQPVQSVDLQHGDRIEAGDTVLQVSLLDGSPDDQPATLRKATAESAETDEFRTSGVPLSVPDPVAAGRWSVPGYELGDKLGEGGMGVVYRARRIADGRWVALKVLKPAVVGSAAEYDRFLREVDILSQLDHPVIVRLQEAGESASLLYFAMELVDGLNAQTWVLKQPRSLPVSVAVGLMGKVLEALAYAHERGYVHRDVKPPNILIQQDGNKLRVKLADFGLARAYQESKLSGLTLLGDICGTPRFMAPEQITDSRSLRPAADQYSAAATLYWMLTRQHTHEFQPSLQDGLRQILLEAPVPLTSRRPDIPAELAAAVERALSKKPEQRFVSIQQFADAILGRPLADR